MSISSRITAMEGHIRNAYDKIEDLGIDTTNTNKNINNISSILETVWDEQSEVLGQGTDIVLKNTRKGKMKLGINCRTEQEQLSGKNLLNGANPTATNYATASMTGNTIKVSSTATNTLPSVSYEFNNVQQGDTFRINAIIKNSNGQIVLQTKQNDSWSTYTILPYNNGTSLSGYAYVVGANVTDIRYLLYANSTIPSSASECNYENVIVAKNNADMTYEPYCRTEYQAQIQTFQSRLKM